MKKLLWLVAWIGGCVVLAAPPEGIPKPAPPADLATAVEQQAKVRAAMDTELTERIGAVKKWYPTALDAVQKDATTRGNLDGVIAVKTERERADRSLTADEMAALQEPLRGVRLKYDQALETLANQQKARELASVRDYVATLNSLEKRLTQQGDIDSALKVREIAGNVSVQLLALETELQRSAPIPKASTPVPTVQAPITPKGPPAPPATPAAWRLGTPPKSGDAAASNHPALVGLWHFSWTETGYKEDFTFAVDGTFKRGGSDKVGTWKVAGDKIILDVPGSATMTIYLPIKPSGTKVVDQRKDRVIKAVKDKP